GTRVPGGVHVCWTRPARDRRGPVAATRGGARAQRAALLRLLAGRPELLGVAQPLGGRGQVAQLLQRRHGARYGRRELLGVAHVDRGELLPRRVEAAADAPQRLLEAGDVGVAAVHRDRKSTRLNSSHVKISYAVFCLKKKNIRIPP